AKRESVTARLNRLTAREADTEIALTKLIEEPKILPNKDEIIKSAVSNNSYLNSLSGLITKRKAQNNLAEKSYFPKLGVGTFYSQRDDRRDFFSVQFSMSLPLWSGRKQKKYIEAARLNVSAVENMYRDEKNSIQAKAVELYNILNEKKERLRLYKTVMIPRAEHSAASALSAYQTDRADFLTYLDSRSLLLNFEIEYNKLLTDYKKNAAGLEYLVGKNFNRIKKEGESHE
ncbi:TolC family protein, partial [bacterium]|nr:TolC family protein [bacterium]